MDKQNIVVTYNASPEQKALFLEVLGSFATLTYLNEIPPAQREQSLEHANILLSWNFPREVLPQKYPRLQQATFIPLLSTRADQMQFAALPSYIIAANNPCTSAPPIAEHAMTTEMAP